VSGVSIGAINGAITAGNPPALRLERLRTFWERITERKIWNYTPDGDVCRRTRNAASSWLTILNGQPGFFTPTQPSPWLSFPGARTATSFYDSAPLRETLLELVDFSLTTRRKRVWRSAPSTSGRHAPYFDNALDTIRAGACDGSGAAAGFADGEDRYGSFLGRRHRIEPRRFSTCSTRTTAST
jgi:NTE family protein